MSVVGAFQLSLPKNNITIMLIADLYFILYLNDVSDVIS